MNERRKPWQRALLLVGSIGPLGHLPASGTVTVAIVGIPLYWSLCGLSRPVFWAITLLFTAGSIWLHQVGDRILGAKDSRLLVWDEIVGFLWAICLLSRFTWQLALVAFLAERAIDIIKVPPANWIEKRWPGGWGVVGDDVVAGIYTCGVLAFLVRFQPTFMGLSG